MLRRFFRAFRVAAREEGFLPVLSAAFLLVLAGTLSYWALEDWHLVDALYFAVATLTTTSVADPELVLEHRAAKVFTIFYLLIGIGVLVELLRRLGMGFVAASRERSNRTPDR
jgi:voltage-gated potassium channel